MRIEQEDDMVRKVKEVDSVIADLQELLTNSVDSPETVMDEVRKHRAERQRRRLAAVRGEWHNRTIGVVGLATATVALMAIACWAHLTMSSSVFDGIAKVAGLVIATAVTVTLLLDDPFHEDLADDASYWNRLQAHGKVVAALAVSGFFCGLLDVRASLLAEEQADDEVVRRVAEGVRQALDELKPDFKDLKDEADAARTDLAAMRAGIGGVSESMSTLQGDMKDLRPPLAVLDSSLDALAKRVGTIARELPSLATTDDVQHATSPLATTAGLTDATEGLATSGELETATKGLVTGGELATATKGLVTSGELATATKGLVTSGELATATKGLATDADLKQALADSKNDIAEAVATKVRLFCVAPSPTPGSSAE